MRAKQLDVVPAARLGFIPNFDVDGPLGDLLVAADVRQQPVKMIWRNRFPVGALSVIAGEPGSGKSCLTALIAAELSRQGHTVLISNIEDDPASVIVPRLEALEADSTRVVLAWDASKLILPRDFDKLDDWILGTRAKLVVLDPIAAHFSSDRAVYGRVALQQLALIARVRSCAIVGVHHFTKTGEIGGPNGGLVGAARGVYTYGYDPRDEDQRALSCVKLNWRPLDSPEPSALILAFEPVIIPVTRGEKVAHGRLRVIGRANIESTRRPGLRSQEQEAETYAWLSETLALAPDCAMAIVDVLEKGAGEGFSWGALNRAATRLDIEHAHARWRLPDEHPLRKGVMERAKLWEVEA